MASDWFTGYTGKSGLPAWEDLAAVYVGVSTISGCIFLHCSREKRPPLDFAVPDVGICVRALRIAVATL
ncbi:hypothetical protein EDD16DRAFT_1708385 [Pisolithus croceorrhizus]|nr:hypothetical protein EV401DRAFT_2080720 [Pisolithus croceorrhizus]KAI6116531.1 hypothetical protein EDD16DRAFT_1708385 [Pisolithus croceorrhizus]KAI6166362.1 hypothetical protein EDD17DRAFT_1753198 [Pisolithus thermaeus]